jgi:hypothetical protein
MRVHRLLLAIAILLIPTFTYAAPSDAPIDLLDYLMQKDDVRNEWTIGGTDVYADKDPDGAGVQTFVLNKFSDANVYEVFKVTETQIQLRYEVMRAGGKKGDDNWIRRFEEVDGEGAAPGCVWVKRFMKPGEGFLSTFRQDRFIFNQKTRQYEIDRDGSVEKQQTWASINWADNEWGDHNKTGFQLNPAIRLTSEWQREGLMLELYDYAKGKGLVAWRWLERINSLRPLEGDTTGTIFHCENGYVLVMPRDDPQPTVFAYDLKNRKQGRPLEVVQFTSHWKPELGPQWYVVYRDSTKEQPLKKKRERIEHSFELPEWGAGKTLSDLPYLFTHPPAQKKTGSLK